MTTKKNLFWHMLMISCAILFTVNFNIWGQEKLITGTVTDAESGTALPGVNVVIEGTQQGTITNIDGLYEISVASDQANLNFSYIGYNTESINVAGRTVIDIRLIPDLQALDEVVVIGYGTMRKRDLTGAVTSVRSADIEANKSTNALQALQGKVAGLDLTTSDGQAGASINITMRGIRSISASNDPLILVDGVEYGNTLDINASDIESIDVLKDVASTAIYGTKGSNGVILITTKKGGDGKMNMSYSNYFSYNMPTYIPDVMDGLQYREKLIQKEISKEEFTAWSKENVWYNRTTGMVVWNEETNPEPWKVFGSVTEESLIASRGVADRYELITLNLSALELLRNNTSLDYLDMIIKNSWSQNHEFSLNGGDEKNSFNLSLGLMDDNGLLRRDKMRRYNFNVGGDHSFRKSIKVGANILYTYKEYNKRDGGIFNQALKCGPIGTLYNEDGTYNNIPDPVWADNQISPMLDEVPGAQVHDILSSRVFGSTYLNWEIFKGLSFRSSLGIDLTITKEGEYHSGNSIQQHVNRQRRSDLINHDSKSYTWNNVLTYKKNIGVHNISLMAGSETYEQVRTRMEITGFEQPLESTQYFDFNGFLQSNMRYKSEYSRKQLLSYFGRANYSLLDKYLFQATIRYDGASVLFPGNKWSFFPSFSTGWRISEEDFMKNIDAVSYLKFRYGWGIAGNYDIPPYSSQTKLSNSLSYISFGEDVYSQYLPFRIGNSDLTWERTATHNIGLDFGLFNNRFSGSVDYYNSRTYDLLFKVPLPSVNVYSEMWDNVASTKNQGIEIALNGSIVNNKTLDWTAEMNFTLNKNKITELREGGSELPYIKDGNERIWKVDSPADAFYYYENDGIYQIEDLEAEFLYVSQQRITGDSIEKGRIPMLVNQFEPGDIKLVDKNNDGQFTLEDRVVMDASPAFLFGLGSNVHLKTKVGKFGLRIYSIGRWGQTISYGFYDRIKDSRDKTNGAYVESWTPQNTSALFPRYSENGNNTSLTHLKSLKYVDGSFIKIKDITFSYMLPNALLNSAKIQNLEVYATLKNMFVFSKLKNYDAEQGGGYDFPLQKNIVFGINVNF
ncbi:MAG: TonB-dependent receptor [Bacteroidales bacterium]